jgi:hypothetical protein
MVESARELITRAGRYWLGAIGGPATALLGLASGIFVWNIWPWIWITVSAALFFFAIIQTYHRLRRECDAALDGLREHRDTQVIADRLTTHHDTGVHDLMHKAPAWPTVQNDFECFWKLWPAWVQEVWDWNDKVRADMERLGCSPYEISDFWTIPDPHRVQTRMTSPRQIRRIEWDSIVGMHARRVHVLKQTASSYEARALAAKRQPLTPAV